ncbi:hypothetical protein [Segniliparus rugosus]|uniref:Uncharacterized protein n=1 Tax=Segniliparus rugosus (strain ATCC BAA-974 / DSM 45345 / CCUG 50838 / CIP 108380 / JCM 13579 / CDC 945) TaxID=679197 RepID=E5XSZ3_SEGRC|nr:hypothetical protein [Segniliparus rugosus]EFV12535.1 hypothetical protein HMPREF9336_02615 [Segniliparus rugosus ATCC BAA-974]
MTPRTGRKPNLRVPSFAAITIVTVVLVIAAALAILGRITHMGDAPPPPVVATQKPSLAEKTPDELRAALMAQTDVPAYLTIDTRRKSPVTAQSSKPPDCSTRLLSERDKPLVEANAYAPDFNGMFYDGRYAVELFLRPQDGEGSLVDFARGWLARCGSFTVSLSGSPEAYPAYAVPIPLEVPGSDSSLGVKVTYAFAKSDPFRNEVFYYAIARIRDIDVLVLSGLPGVAEELAGKAAAKLVNL